MYFFGDSFDLYALPADALLGYWDSGNTSFNLVAGRFSGSRGFTSGNLSATTAVLLKNSGSNDAVHHINVAFQQVTALGTVTNYQWFTFFDGASAQCSIVFRLDGSIILTSGASSGAVLATYSNAFTANTWYAFEFEVLISNTAGYMNVRRNGNTSNDFASATNLNTRAGTTNNYANRLSIGCASVTTNHYIDDLLWRSDAGSVPWVGDIRCYTRRPDTDAAAAWTRPGTFQMQPYFGATTNNSLSANGVAYTPFISQGGIISSVVVNLTAGYTGNMKCAIYASSGGQPGTVLQSATAPINNPVLGTNTFTFSPSVSISKGTQFFVAVCVDAATGTFWAQANTAPYTTAAFSGTTTYASFPVANPTTLSASAAKPIFPVVTPAANADLVSEPYEDAAASYVYSANVNDTDQYTLTGTSSVPTTVVGVTTRGLFQKSDAGTRNAVVQLKSGGTTVESASTALNTTWGWIARTDLTDPATGAAWTPSGVSTAQVGARVAA